MKQATFFAILILVSCFAVSAQTNTYKNDSAETAAELIGEFNDADNECNKLTVDIIKSKLSKNSSTIGLIRIRNDKNFRQRLNSLKKAIAFQKADSNRIVFLIVEKQTKDTNILTIQDCTEILRFENCIIVRATDTDKIEKLFRQKTKRNR